MTRIFSSIVLFIALGFSAACQHSVPATENSKQKAINTTIPVNDFEKQIKEKKDIQIVDVRTPDEFKGGHLKNAFNIDYRNAEFTSQVDALDKSKPTYVYCLSGGRSASAASQMEKMGFIEVYNMEGGMLKWNAAGKAVENPAASNNTPGMSMIEFNKLLSGDKYILVDFNAPWCAPCMKMLPELEALVAEKKDKLSLVKIDADKNKNLMKEKGINGIPHLELYKGGQLIWKHDGYISRNQLLLETKL